MKILYVITKSELGGAQVHVAQLLKGMRERGCTLALMSYPGGWLEDKAREYGAIFYPNTYFSNSYNPFRALRAIITAWRAVRAFDPDIVHCHSSGGGFFGRMAVRGRRPTVFTAHSWAFTTGAPRFRAAVAVIVEKIASWFTTKIICVSTFDCNLARRYRIAKKHKLIIIHNAVDVEAIVPLEKSSEKTRIIFVGRLAYPKEIALMIESFALLSEEIRGKASLTIVGYGPEKESLEELIRTHNAEHFVTILQTDHDTALRTLQESDVFILLSKHEGFPMTILEAMAAGLPIIASNVGGIPEAVDDRCGILVANTQKDVSSAFATLLQQKDRRLVMGRAARERACAEFSLERFIETTAGLYKQILEP